LASYVGLLKVCSVSQLWRHNPRPR